MASTVSITINSRQFAVDASLNLLAALAGENVFLSAACGGRGSCGTCKCTVQSPVIPHTLKEIPYLTAGERAAGVHLSCQTRVEADMQVSVSDLVLAARSLPAHIKNIEFIDSSQAIVSLETDGDGISFLAGQFALLQIASAPETAPIQRAYSFISSPINFRFPAFLVDLKKGGAMSHYIGEKARIGDSVILIGPYGEFGPFAEAESELWIASNSGLAPFLSMLEDSRLWEPRNTKRTLIYRSKGQSDSVLYKKITDIRGSDSNFRLYSHPAGAGNGTLVKILHEFLQTSATIPEHVLICAAAPEIDACTNLLMSIGINSSRIRRDAF